MRCSARKWLGIVLTAAIALVAASVASGTPAQPRVALVVGNAAYPSRPLATATNDAGLIAQALAQAGFDVTAAADLDQARLGATFRAFVEKVRGAGPNALVVVYLAGLGVQLDGDNYLVPVDAKIEHAADAAREAASLADFERALAAIPATTRILVYDLARDNAFAARDGMPLAPGLALEAPSAGALVAFGAAPGATAPDDVPPYGAYARALAEMIGTPGLPIGLLFDRVRLRVGELTDGAVVPWNGGAIDGGLAILPSAEGAPRLTAGSIAAMPIAALTADIAYSAVIARDTFSGYTDFARLFPSDPLAERVRAILAVRREALTWASSVAADDPRAYWTYVRRYPRGPHLFDARRRLARLGASLEPPPRFDIFPFPDVPPPPVAELARRDAEPHVDPPSIPPPPGAFLPTPNVAYFDDLPPPGPAPAGALPIVAPLPPVAEGTALAADGRVTQYDVPAHGPLTARTQVAADGDATLTLAGAAGGVIARVATSIGPGETRVILQEGPKGALEARTTMARDTNGLTATQTDAKGAIILRIVTQGDRGGGRTTTMTDAQGAFVAELRRDARGIVVARRVVEAQPALVAAQPALLLPPTLPPSGAPAPPVAAPVLPTAPPKPAQKPTDAPATVGAPPAAPPIIAPIAPPLRPAPKSPAATTPPASLAPATAPPPPPPVTPSTRPLPAPAKPVPAKPAPGKPAPAKPTAPLQPVTPLPPAVPPSALPPPAPMPRPEPPSPPAPLSAAPERAATPPLPPRRPALPAVSAKKSGGPAHPAAKARSRAPRKRKAGSPRR